MKFRKLRKVGDILLCKDGEALIEALVVVLPLLSGAVGGVLANGVEESSRFFFRLKARKKFPRMLSNFVSRSSVAFLLPVVESLFY
jgi:hypothetical protein